MDQLNRDKMRALNQYIKLREKKMEDYVALTDSNDAMAVFLKGHLFVEQELTAILENFILHPSIIFPKGRRMMMFYEKYKWAKALGLVPPEMYASIEELNRIRNKLGHSMNYTYDETEYNNFVKTVDPLHKKSFNARLYAEQLGSGHIVWQPGNTDIPPFSYVEKTKVLISFIWEKLFLVNQTMLTKIDIIAEQKKSLLCADDNN